MFKFIIICLICLKSCHRIRSHVKCGICAHIGSVFHLRCNIGSVFHVHLRQSPLRRSSLPTNRSKMLSAYTASVEFINTQKEVMGPDHRCVHATHVFEVAQLTKIIRTTKPCRCDITALMKFAQLNRSNAFPLPEQQSLLEAALLRLSSLVAEDGTLSVHMEMHGSQKGQTHMYSYKYYTDAE